MSAPPKFAPVPDAPARSPETPPATPLLGTIARAEGKRYSGWCRCTGCDRCMTLHGERRTAEDDPTGDHVWLATAGCGRRQEGEWRAGRVRLVCGACGRYNVFAVEVDRTGPVPVAMLFMPARTGA